MSRPTILNLQLNMYSLEIAQSDLTLIVLKVLILKMQNPEDGNDALILAT